MGPARRLLIPAMAVIAAGLALLIVYRPGLETETAAIALTSRAPEDIRQIRLQRLQGETLSFTRSLHGWAVAGGDFSWPADAFQVRNLLSLLQADVVRQYPRDALDPAAVGLQPAQAQVVFDDMTVVVGGVEPIDRLRYVQTANRIALIQDRFPHLLNAGISNFISRRLLIDDAAITRLELPGQVLERSNGVDWTLQPPQDDIGAGDIDALIGAWQNATALYAQLDATETTAAGERIRIGQGGHGTVELVIVARDPELVLARPDSGIRYHLNRSAASTLLALPAPSDRNL